MIKALTDLEHRFISSTFLFKNINLIIIIMSLSVVLTLEHRLRAAVHGRGAHIVVHVGVHVRVGGAKGEVVACCCRHGNGGEAEQREIRENGS